MTFSILTIKPIGGKLFGNFKMRWHAAVNSDAIPAVRHGAVQLKSVADTRIIET